ncbi:MAG: acyl-ACP--UDP-N-acetylglucosamine O-acyltransferase [Opitutaceae bacterium]
MENGGENAESKIHPSAVVAAGVRIGAGAVIGPGAVVEADVTIGAGCRLSAHAILRSGTILGDRVEVDSFSVIGGLPQDLHFDRTLSSGVRIGGGTVIRESVTISRATRAGGYTEIGSECLFMAGSHAGHDCRIGDKAILANGVLLGGHVSVGAHTFIGGAAAVHQFCRIGESVMLAGHASITMDLPSFLIVVDRNDVVGLNLVGLRRRGVSREAIIELKEALRHVYAEGKPADRAGQAMAENRFRTEEAGRFLSFFGEGKRGFARPRRERVGE